MLSIFSVPVSSSKSPLHPGAEPPDTQEARIRPGFLPLLWGVLAVVVQARLCHRQGAIEVGPAIVALISVLALILAGLLLHRQRAIPQVVDHTGDPSVPDLPKSVRPSARWPILLLAGVLVSFAAGFLFVLWTVVAAVLLLLSGFFFRRLIFLKDLLNAILAGTLFLGTATAMGDTLAGGYPAALAFFFLLAWAITISVEHHARNLQDHRITLATLFGPRIALAVAGVFFFVFGIVASWPFLNEFYSPIYFWIMVVGVDLPLLWMWGRLRGRNKELSEAAIVTFNHWVRPLTFVAFLALFLA